MWRSTFLGFALWAAWGSVSGCESEPPSAIGTAEFHPWPGGNAGSAGTATEEDASGAGSGSDAATEGGAGAAPGGAKGAGGAAGAGGGTGQPFRCAEACDQDSDCASAQPNQNFRCNRARERCEGFAAPCRDDAECIPGASQWLWICSSDEDCFFFDEDVCVNVAGVGRCARPAPDATSSGGCVFPVPDLIVLPKFAGAETVRICAETGQKCHQGSCLPACESDQQCDPDRNGSSCNRETGLCECARDEDCRGAGVSRCNTATRRCECASDLDCPGLPNANVCVAGSCGCGSVAACNGERTFSGTRYVCE
jgi:hypothetical protein